MPRNYDSLQLKGQALLGLQTELVVKSTPPASEAQIGSKLRGLALTAGVYTAEVDVSALGNIEVQLQATLNGGTITSDVYVTFADEATKKVAFAGVGALVTATLQTSTYANKGERIVIIKLTVTGAPVLTIAEINGY
jgi:hypothetical protein